MMFFRYTRLLTAAALAALVLLMAAAGCTGTTAGGGAAGEEITVTDGFGRSVTAPSPPESVVCSGSGCLRYLVYLQAQDLVVGVDDIEKKEQEAEGRPYALAYGSKFKDLPLIGEFRGKDDPEKIISIGPDVVFKTGSTGTAYGTSAAEADKLEDKTGIPVVAFPYGSLRDDAEKAEMYGGLRVMGEVLGKQDRAEEVIAYIDATMADLERRTGDIPAADQKSVYVGGISSAGAHGIISTEPAYPPFLWVHAKNVATGLGTAHADVAKEALVNWDPEYIFIDAGTTQMESGGAVGELKNDAALAGLSAAKNGKVYGVLPYNFYNTNYETVLADAYFVGKTLYPDRFADVDPVKKADEIYTFFVGKPVFGDLNGQYSNLGFAAIPL
ncbi:MAG TPA: iron ABC transporter substrate-binding protein [Methanoculleus sp.]|jgi:iron complex transport system substrate-binding protein|nr:iron ABC transporter substrate-binding protein [Methanoculleus sp.]HNV39027.1 iron ABC transporter substrate-binding protein [Methanoculleus sp.]HOC83301.1 iron ABC transporter substrate-binding protein [Methanoculleus sp.]HOF96541.1 iron ABC transporter substrate-binding protein [Methanoculleus sp.]HOI60605.1 iron ABC transporter substrate-binding protein [Methanoculleus sp.]